MGKINAAVSSWHGTLFSDRDESNLWTYVGAAYLIDSIPSHPYRTAKLVAAAYKLKQLLSAYKRGETGFDPIYDEFNRSVLAHLEPDEVDSYVKLYASKPKTRAKIDQRMLNPILETPLSSRDILSTGYRRGVELILGREIARQFNIFGNSIWKESDDFGHGKKGCKFKLITTGDDKSRLLETIFDGKLEDVAYVGDSEDDLGALRAAGHPIVSLSAPDEFKQLAATEVQAFVPESEADFRRYLQAA